MMSFDEIATKLLESQGFTVLPCSSDAEAVDRAEELKNGSKFYPVHYSVSDTSGEKAYEEFFTDEETTDMTRLSALGVVTGKAVPAQDKIDVLFRDLTSAFEKENVTKAEIVKILKGYLPNFEHIETQKSLDTKM